MAGVNSIFNTASSSIAAQRAALEITGENIANVNTPGYSRQRPILETAPGVTTMGFVLGNGVLLTSVQRFYDAVLQQNITDGNSSFQNNQTRSTALQQIELSFNEIANDGLGKSIQDFFDSWQSLSLNASGTTERQTVLTRAEMMVDNFHQINDSLRSVQINADNSLEGLTADISDKASRIADLNVQIVKTELISSGNANELRDKRDYLIQELGSKVGVTFSEEKDGSMTVLLPGGAVLVQGEKYASLSTSKVANLTDLNNVNPVNEILITPIGNPPRAIDPILDTNLTATVGGINNSMGEIGAALAIRDDVIPGYLLELDELAYNLAYQVNTQHKLGWNLNGTQGTDFFAPLTPSSLPATSATIAGYSRTDNGTGVGIKLNISSTNEIAAADADPSISGSGNNNNALALEAIRNTRLSFSSGSNTVVAYFSAMVSGIGLDTLAYKNATTQGESFLRQLNNQRESNSGVSLDEELTNIIKYQKAFQGAARMVTTATEMMDIVLGMVR